MPLDADHAWSEDRVLTGAEIRAMIDARLSARAGRRASRTRPRASTASATGGARSASSTRSRSRSARDCNRIRLTAEGKLRTCLFSLHETDLREPLRAGAGDDELEQIDPRRRLAQGAQAPRLRARLPPAAAHDEPDRRLSDGRGREPRSPPGAQRRGRRRRPPVAALLPLLVAEPRGPGPLRRDPAHRPASPAASRSGSTRSRRRSSSASTACTTSRT